MLLFAVLLRSNYAGSCCNSQWLNTLNEAAYVAQYPEAAFELLLLESDTPTLQAIEHSDLSSMLHFVL